MTSWIEGKGPGFGLTSDPFHSWCWEEGAQTATSGLSLLTDLSEHFRCL